MSNPTVDAVHINSALTGLSRAEFQKETDFIGTKIFPIIPVSNKSDDYWIWNSEDTMRTEMDIRQPGTESAGTDFNVTTGEYNAKTYALHIDRKDQVAANADFDYERAQIRVLNHKTLQFIEQKVVSTFLAGSIWNTDQTGVASDSPGSNEFTQWDADGGDPQRDIALQTDVIKLNTNKRPNTLVVGAQVMTALKLNPYLMAQFSYTGTRVLSDAQVAEALGVQRLLVADSVKATNAKGQTKTTAFNLGKVAWLGYVNPNPGLEDASAGYIFNWTGLDDSGFTEAGPNIYQFAIPEKRVIRYEAQIAFDMKVANPYMGKFFASAIG